VEIWITLYTYIVSLNPSVHKKMINWNFEGPFCNDFVCAPQEHVSANKKGLTFSRQKITEMNFVSSNEV